MLWANVCYLFRSPIEAISPIVGESLDYLDFCTLTLIIVVHVAQFVGITGQGEPLLCD